MERVNVDLKVKLGHKSHASLCACVMCKGKWDAFF
jgi:hypothetical protein